MLLVIHEMAIFRHLVLIILNEIVNVHNEVPNAVIIGYVTSRILYEIEVVDYFEEFEVERHVFLVEKGVFIVEAIFEVHCCHSL